MAYHYVRQPLRAEEADALSHACETTEEKLIIWTLLDTGLRVSELCRLTPQHMLWQQKALRVLGKGGPYGKQSKLRIVPMSKRIQPLMEHYFAMHETWFVGPRQVQKIVKRLANRAKITQDVTPHVLRHTFATLALQKNISLAAVQKILDHDRLTTTAIYLNLTDTHIVEEFGQKWQAGFGKIPEYARKNRPFPPFILCLSPCQGVDMDQQTVTYYEQYASRVVKATEVLDTAAARQHSRQRFCAYLKPGATVLDLGCGSGRDSKFFAEMGYRVTAVDASQAMASLASEICGFAVETMDFTELEAEEEFDGVWASASLLHCRRADLEAEVLPRIRRALKKQGILYVYLKDGEGVRRDERGRLLQFYREGDLREMFREWEGLEFWQSESILGRGERWVNGIVRA